MNKAQLVESVAKGAKLTKKDATAAVEATLGSIKRATKKEGVQIAGFGTFAVANRKARKGRNPRTGEEIRIKASKNVRFKAGKAFKDML